MVARATTAATGTTTAPARRAAVRAWAQAVRPAPGSRTRTGRQTARTAGPARIGARAHRHTAAPPPTHRATPSSASQGRRAGPAAQTQAVRTAPAAATAHRAGVMPRRCSAADSRTASTAAARAAPRTPTRAPTAVTAVMTTTVRTSPEAVTAGT